LRIYKKNIDLGVPLRQATGQAFRCKSSSKGWFLSDCARLLWSPAQTAKTQPLSCGLFTSILHAGEVL